jgi:DNA-binding Lrp family transcriptional regulator
VIKIKSDDNPENKKDSDNANEIAYLHLLRKNTNNDSSKKSINILKETTKVVDANDEKSTNSSEYSNSSLNTFITADKFDVLIIKELLRDPAITTLEISIKLGIPLHIANKKRRLIESKVLQIKYFLDLQKLGFNFQFADVFADIQVDKVNDFVRQLYATYFTKNIIKIMRVKGEADGICIKTLYKNSEELFFLMDKIKSNSSISNVRFSEQVEVVGDNTLDVVLNILHTDSKNKK